MSDSDLPKYVIDLPFGGAADYDQVVGPGAPEISTPHERVWPAIPTEFCPPEESITNTVAEVSYLLTQLTLILTPTPLPTDDLPLMSSYLLSLETRFDITAHVLLHTSAKMTMLNIRRIHMKDDSAHNFKSRAAALAKYWGNHELTAESTPQEILADRPIAPFITSLPSDKPSDWKLHLDESRKAEAQRHLFLLNTHKNRCIKYWTTVKPPRAIGWAPVGGEAWNKVPRKDIENGNLYHTPYFEPIWESFDMACFDVAFWKDPENSDEAENKYKELMAEKHESVKKSLEAHRVRQNFLEDERIAGGGVWTK